MNGRDSSEGGQVVEAGGEERVRVVAFVNQRVGCEVVRHVVEKGPGTLVGLVLHPSPERSWGDEILEASGLDPASVLEAPELRSDSGLARLVGLEPDIGLSAYFGFILKPEVLDLFPRGCINLHPSFLPYNRGSYPNVWSIVEGTPAGASLHYMVEEVDAGAIIARRRVPVSPTDTGASLYKKLQEACLDLFRDEWSRIAHQRVEATVQSSKEGSHHRVSDVQEIDEIHLHETYTARELIDRLRARTFPPHEGCYFVADGRKVFLRLGLWWEEEYPPEETDPEADRTDTDGTDTGGD